MDIAKRLVVLLLLSAFSVVSWAHGKVMEESQVIVTCNGAGGISGTGATYSAACMPLIEAAKAAYSDPFYGTDKSWLPGDPRCTSDAESTGGCSGVFRCGGAGNCQVSAAGIKKTGSICPPASTAIPGKPGNCECQRGYKPNGNSCSPYQCPSKGAYSVVTQPDIQVENVGPQCYGGCTVNPSSFKGSPDGKIYATWPYVSTGEACGGKTAADSGATTGESKVADAPVKCGAGQCPGTVNGTFVCVPCANTTIPGASSAASGAGTSSNGLPVPDGGTSSTQSECTQSSCSTTTTVRDKDGNVVGTKTDEKPKENFCQENPGLQICKEGRWGGNCGGGYTCDGDAVQCALAREVHTRNCQLYDTPNELSDIGSAAMNSQAVPDGHPGKNPESKNFASMFRPMEGNAACIPDKTVSLAGKSVVLPFSQVCDPLRWMGHIAFAFALVHAAFFVFRKL